MLNTNQKQRTTIEVTLRNSRPGSPPLSGEIVTCPVPDDWDLELLTAAFTELHDAITAGQITYFEMPDGAVVRPADVERATMGVTYVDSDSGGGWWS